MQLLILRERLKSHTPVTLEDEINLSDVTFLLVDVPVVRIVQELARDKTQTDFKGESTVKLISCLEE